MLPSAVVFDAFGTLLEIKHKTHPYRMLLRQGARQGRAIRPSDLRSLMTLNCTIGEAADRLGILIPQSKLEVIEAALARELESITPYPDGLEAVEMLLGAGIRVGICSNLSQGYGGELKRLFACVDAFALSYEAGSIKPEPAIYNVMCASLGVQPGRDWMQGMSSVLMIGDSPKCDRDGPRIVGISGHLLTRQGGGISDLVQFVELVLRAKAQR